VSSQEKAISVDKLIKAGNYCNMKLFQMSNKSSNIGKLYLKYKAETKSKHEYDLISRHLVGSKIMDFGSGDGTFSNHLVRRGFEVWGVDVRDYRRGNKEMFHFILMDAHNKSLSSTTRFDTTIVKSVLHHIENKKLGYVLDKISRVTKSRILIKEDIISNKRHNNVFETHSVNNVLFQRYSQLCKGDKRQFLALMDYYGNCVVQGLSFINLPFNFKTIEDWNKTLRRHGIVLKDTILVLFDLNMLHSGPHVWLVCDVEK
jgi:SAM-dependent methyltransferase